MEHPSFLPVPRNRLHYLMVTFTTAVLIFPLVWNWQSFRPTLPIRSTTCACVCVCVWHCGGGHDGSLETVGLLTQQRGMFSFGYKAFLRDLRRGCGQNNASLGYAKLEWVDFYEGHRRSCFSPILDRWMACQSHLWFQHPRGVWIQRWWAAKHAVSLCQQQGSGQT